MKRVIRSLIVALVVLLLSSSVHGADYTPKQVIEFFSANRMDMLIKPLSIQFDADIEIEGILRVYWWVHKRYDYVKDDEVGYWTSSDTMFTRLRGDCEDWAMLFVALARFSLNKPIPADRIHVIVSYTPRGTVHAWVLYTTPEGHHYSINPTDTGQEIVPGIWLRPILKFNDKMAEWTPYMWKEE